MGLDMFLNLRKYESVCSWEDNFSTERLDFYPKELNVFEKDIIKRNFLSKTTTYQIGYWRKANAIHNWFVEHCADGEDNCKPVYVSLENAEELLKTCKTVWEDHNKAEELLPTQSGFFFGSTEYDDWYYEDLEYTIELLEKVIKFVKEQKNKKSFWDIVYDASW